MRYIIIFCEKQFISVRCVCYQCLFYKLASGFSLDAVEILRSRHPENWTIPTPTRPRYGYVCSCTGTNTNTSVLTSPICFPGHVRIAAGRSGRSFESFFGLIAQLVGTCRSPAILEMSLLIRTTFTLLHGPLIPWIQFTTYCCRKQNRRCAGTDTST